MRDHVTTQIPNSQDPECKNLSVVGVTGSGGCVCACARTCVRVPELLCVCIRECVGARARMRMCVCVSVCVRGRGWFSHSIITTCLKSPG